MSYLNLNNPHHIALLCSILYTIDLILEFMLGKLAKKGKIKSSSKVELIIEAVLVVTFFVIALFNKKKE